MDSSEMEAIVKAAGWIPIKRKRRNRVYLYASKRRSGKMEEHYVGPLSKVEAMTSEQFKALLQKKIAS